MKKSAKIATLAIALFTGISGTAMANGTEVPPPPPPAPEPYTAPAPAPEVKPMSKSGPYISGDVGAAIWGKSGVKTGYVLNGAIGYNFDPARVEFAVGYQENDQDFNGKMHLWTYLANAYYDFDAGSGVKPYLMLGLGAVDNHNAPVSNDKTEFCWQVGTGLGFNVADNTMFDIGYRYFKPDNGDSHNIIAGIRYQF